MDLQALSKLIEPVTARLDVLEQRLARIESALERLTSALSDSDSGSNSTVERRGHAGRLYSKIPPSTIPRKRPLDQSIPELVQAFSYPPYRYRPLDASKNEIRLFSLDPSTNSTDPITGTILHISIDDVTIAQAQTPFSEKPFFGPRVSHHYTALSYAWGDLADPGGTDILIAGAALPVTANLAAALRQLRSSEATAIRSLWWIDALCINQSDMSERNAQVALMRRIYGNAAHVEVWLGCEAEGSATAMALVRMLGHPPRRGPAHSKAEYPYVPDDVRRSNLACLAALFQRAWWDRVWVRQEVALGRSVSLLCGNEKCTLEEMTSAELSLEDSLLHLRLESKRSDMAHVRGMAQGLRTGRAEGFMELREKSSRGDRYIDLCTLLLHARACKATNLQDKVFGVLGLADPSVYQLSVEYRLNVEHVYRMAATAIITKTRNLNILSAAQNVDRSYSLPSWAPNLTDPWKAQPFPPNTTFSSLHQLANKPAQCHVDASGMALTVTGHIHGRIKRLSMQAAKNTHSNRELAEVRAAWTNFAQSILTAKPPVFNFGGYLHEYQTAEEATLARLLLVQPGFQQHRQPRGGGVYTFGSGQPMVDVVYARSLLAPEAWIESSVADSGFQEGMRWYGVGRRIGHCKEKDVGLFPEDAKEGDVVVYLYGAVNAYVLRETEEGYLLVGDANIEPPKTIFGEGKKDDFQFKLL